MKNQLNQSRSAAALAATITALLVSAQAGAQAPTRSASVNDQAANEIAEVMVTARQRAEKLVDVPATVQAFTATESATCR